MVDLKRFNEMTTNELMNIDGGTGYGSVVYGVTVSVNVYVAVSGYGCVNVNVYVNVNVTTGSVPKGRYC